MDIRLEEAQKIVEHILNEVLQDGGSNVAICVVDIQGTVVMSVRMNGVKPASVDYARRKAKTVLALYRNTIEVGNHYSGDDLQACYTAIPDFCHFAGGVAIRDFDGGIIGAIGVSNRTPEQDHQLAKSGANSPWHGLKTFDPLRESAPGAPH